MQNSIIELENMEFYAFHGCYREEKIVGNKFIVYLRAEVDASVASKTDSVADTVSYLELYQIVKQQMEQGSNILEHVAKRILDAITTKYESISKLSVKISKLNPPLGGQIERVSVTLSFPNN